MKSGLKRLLSMLFTLALFVGPALGFIYRQQVYDWWRLRGYDPPAKIEALAERTTMTPSATRIFYVNHPELNNSQEFNQHCHIEEFSIILGCFINRQGIYIYKVTDKRLDGIAEVTAAHEMLHAAYERLGTDEKNKLNQQLVSAFNKLDNDRLTSTIKSYERQDPSSVPNELHSILGTEVRDLPDSLESYYKRYFKDRYKVVDLSDQYEKVFASRQEKVRVMDEELADLKNQIENEQADLTAQQVQLRADRAQLDSLRQSGDTSAYNAGVNSFNAQVAAYNISVSSVRSLIERYNSLVKERNAIAVEVKDLTEAIDSTPERFN